VVIWKGDDRWEVKDDMKIWMISFLSLLLGIAITLIMDLMMGMSLFMSITNLKNPFWVMTLPEYVILFMMLAVMFTPTMSSFFKQRKQAQTLKKP
jgi:sterol desaturase/sphingolipid hydroxylase (fatty acid hydroxylase superfamily)